VAFLSGITGSITIDGQIYTLAKWKASLKTALPKVNNFTSPFQQLVAGLQSATITIEGPYNAGLTPLTSGAFVTMSLGWESTLGLDLDGYIESLDPDNDIEGAPRVSVTVQSSGAFTVSIT
jgi:hypothetical protein